MTDSVGISDSNVTSIDAAEILASLTAWASAFGRSRQWVQEAVARAHVRPKAARNGYPLYAGRDMYSAFCGASVTPTDPESLSPFNRRAWYQADFEKLNVEKRCSELVAAYDLEQMIARFAKVLFNTLNRLDDSIERELDLTDLQAARARRHTAQVRENLHQALFDGPVLGTGHGPPAREGIREASTSSRLEAAVEFLRNTLAQGPTPSRELIHQAKASGLSESTLRRAKAKLGTQVQARRQGRVWTWSLAT